MSDIRILYGVIGIILLSVVCVAKQSLITSRRAEDNAPNRTQLQQEICNFLSQVETADHQSKSKFGDFIAYRKQKIEQYFAIEEPIRNKEIDFDGFKHVFCQDLETDFRNIGNELNKSLDDYNGRFEKNQEKIDRYKNNLENIEHDFNKCNETIDKGCLNDIVLKLSGFINMQAQLKSIINIMEEDYINSQAEASVLLSNITTLGGETRLCLSKLSDMEDKIILDNSSIIERINKVNKHFAKELSDSKLFAKTLEQTFVTDLDQQISTFKERFEEYQRNAKEKHLNVSKCIYNETKFEDKKQKFSKLFCETADAFISTIDNETSTVSEKIRKCATNFDQELDALSKCSSETCLSKVVDLSQNKTNFVMASIMEVSKAYENMISELKSNLNKNASNSVENFFKDIDQGVICLMQLEAEKRISDLGIAYKELLDFARTNFTLYHQNAAQYINSFNISYSSSISMVIKNMEERDENETKNNIDISRCPSRSKVEISNNMKKFDRKMTQIENQTISYFTETRVMISVFSHLTETFLEKLNLCSDESCLNATVDSYEKQSKSNLDIIEKKTILTSNYIEKIKLDLSELLNDSLRRSTADFNELTTCLSTAEEIHKQGLSLNSSLDVILNNFDDYLRNITIFVIATKDAVDGDVKSKLNSAVKEIEAKKGEAYKEKLDLKSCAKIDDLQHLVTAAMTSFNSDINNAQKNVNKTVGESIGNVQSAKSFTRKHLHDLDECSTEQCMKDLTKDFEKEIKEAISAGRVVNDSLSQHILRIRDSVKKLGENYLNKTVTDLDVSKKKVIDCLVAELNSSSMFTPSFIIILSIFFVKLIINILL